MSCLDKRHLTHGGGMQGLYKYTDGFSDTSSVGSFMDDTDREVSSLTDRAFRSLCIGDEAVYNDSEFASSPVERYDAFSLDAHNADVLKFNGQKALSQGRRQNGGGVAAAGEPTVGATFQQSVLDMARKGLKNGAIETAWQHSRSALVTSGGGTTAESHQRGQVRSIKDFEYKNSSNDLWENSALLNVRGEPSAGHERGHFKPTKNHFHSSGDAPTQTAKKDPEKPSGKSSKSKRGKSGKLRKPSNKNFFLHSEDSPFESWRDRILLEQNHTPDPVSANQRPMWYDSPLYKELTAEHGLQIPAPKENEPNQTKSEDAAVSPAPPPPSTPPPSTPPPPTPPAAPPSSVLPQKTTAVEQRSESESGSCLPPWRKSRDQTMAALPWSRPRMAASCREREVQGKLGVAPMGRANGTVAAAGVATVATPVIPITTVTVVTPITSITVVTPSTSVAAVTPVTAVTTVMAVKTVDEPASTSSTPFSISQLLTPIINTRQGTGTSEVLQSTLSPSSLDLDLSPSSFTDASAKPTGEAKSRNSYKAIASGLLFNLKDNRKRVKSTYSPTKFKTTDFGKQPSKPETAEPKYVAAISEAPVAEAHESLQPKVSDVRPAGEVAPESTDAQTVDHKKPADGGISGDYLTLSSPYGVKEAAVYGNLNSTRESAPGKIQHAESGNDQYRGLQQPKSDRAQLWERQGSSHPYPALNLYKAASVTETIEPVVDMAVSYSAINDSGKESGIKETRSLRDRLFINGAEVEQNEIRTGDDYHDGGDRHNDRDDIHVNKQNENSKKKPALSVKDRVELVEKNYSKNQFAAQKRDSVKQETFDHLDKHHTKEKSLASKENPKQRLTPVQEKEHDKKDVRTNHVFSARQNQFIKNERYTIKEDNESDQADEENDAVVTRYNKPIFTSGDLQNKEHQNVEQGEFPTKEKHVAGDIEALKSHEGVLLTRDSEFVRNEINANSRNGNTRQEVLEEAGVESKSRLLRSENVLPDTEEGPERLLHSTRGNPPKTRGSLASTECLQPVQDSLLIKESAAENEALAITGNKQDKKKVLEEVHGIREEKTSLKSTENDMHFIGEKNVVNMGLPAEMNKPLTTHGRFAVVEEDQKKHWNEIKEYQPSENNVLANNERAVIQQESPKRELDTFAEKEKESKVRDTRSKSKERAKQEDGRDSEQTSAGVNVTQQNEQEKGTLMKEKIDSKGNGKSDSTLAGKEKDSKLKQIRKLKDKVKDVFSMREHKAKEEVTEKQDKREEKQEATQKHEEDHKQLLPRSNTETKNAKHGGFEVILEESTETEKEFPSEIQDSRETVPNDITQEAIREQAVTVHRKRRPAPPVPPKPDIKGEGQPSQTGMPTESSADPHLSAEEIKSKSPEQEMQARSASGDAEGQGEESEESLNKMATKDPAEMSPLQYYAISDGESEIDTRSVASPLRESTPHKLGSTTSLNDLDEGGWVRCLIEYAKSQTPRSNTSSPSSIKPTLFKVKDNTFFRTSPLTKTIKSPLHRSFPEDFRLSSPRDSWSGSEKGEDERGRLRERVRVHSPREASVSRRGSRLRETPVRSPMAQPSVTPAAQEHRSPQWSPQAGTLSPPSRDPEEGRLAASALLGGLESSSANGVDVVEEKASGSLHIEETVGVKEPSEKSESVCSAGEVQPLGKPPPVLPKSEKALRRAKRLTNKRMKKAEAEGKHEGKSRARSNSARERRSQPQPPAETLPLQPAHTPSPAPKFCPEPGPSQHPHPPSPAPQFSPKPDPSQHPHPPSPAPQFCPKPDPSQPAHSPPAAPQFCPKPDPSQPAHPPSPAPQYCPEPSPSQSAHPPSLEPQFCPEPSPSQLAYPPSPALKFCPEPSPSQPAYPPSPALKFCPEPSPSQPAYPPSPALKFCPEPSPSQPTPNTVSQSFPVTQRKLLQDPDSGQYFMVDMPVQVRTKMFFDPETGKYIQLPVQAPEVVSSHPPSMEILNAPYLLYPGFVPVPISTLPPQGSTSQTPASLMEDQETLQSRSAPCRQEDCQQTQSKEAETYIEPACVPYDCFPEEPLYMDDEDCTNSRNLNAVSASELDSFAVDNV
ncbi:cardiac-enriched FHL2-interacting protein [Anguilla anguilla]|uniref:cardiac-enriched FHL2-interacting protein n=1 Tax=Anguilla anguilla TaxID=7936 RepID=UPI0015ADD3BA|nr:cardiac-enriched FHL2-interacting protein [Anguilla anguilla]